MQVYILIRPISMHMYIYYITIFYAYRPIHIFIYDYLLPLYCNACLYIPSLIYLYMFHSSKPISHNTCSHISPHIYSLYMCICYLYIHPTRADIVLQPWTSTCLHTPTSKYLYMDTHFYACKNPLHILFAYIYSHIHLWIYNFLRTIT
jgi:hypothetical protein